MQKRFILVAALGLIVLLAGGAMILVKPRQKAVAEYKASYAEGEALTDNASGRRHRAQKLKAASEVSLKVGDYETAMSERLKMLEWKNPKISNLSTLSYYAIQSSALNDIGHIASRLDAATARRFADQLEARDAELFTYSQVLVGQKADELKQVDDAVVKGDWNQVAEDLEFSAQEKAILKTTSLAKIKSNIAASYDQAIANAKSPYSAPRAKSKTALDPYTKNYATAYMADRFLWTRAKTQRVLTILALHARADRLEKKMANKQLPLDPFGKGSLQSKAGVVYSVGPDGVDNGGVLMSTRYQVGAIGDVLAPMF